MSSNYGSVSELRRTFVYLNINDQDTALQRHEDGEFPLMTLRKPPGSEQNQGQIETRSWNYRLTQCYDLQDYLLQGGRGRKNTAWAPVTLSKLLSLFMAQFLYTQSGSNSVHSTGDFREIDFCNVL